MQNLDSAATWLALVVVMGHRWIIVYVAGSHTMALKILFHFNFFSLYTVGTVHQNICHFYKEVNAQKQFVLHLSTFADDRWLSGLYLCTDGHEIDFTYFPVVDPIFVPHPQWLECWRDPTSLVVGKSVQSDSDSSYRAKTLSNAMCSSPGRVLPKLNNREEY